MTNPTGSGLTSYHTFIVRIWLEENEKVRVVLMDTTTGERWVFTQFEALSDCLRQKAGGGM